ncbi:DUF3443 family protein [Pararobbsia silviterrae]|nr:DUF3443 family protein [Pararobbsia silviterrae]
MTLTLGVLFAMLATPIAADRARLRVHATPRTSGRAAASAVACTLMLALAGCGGDSSSTASSTTTSGGGTTSTAPTVPQSTAANSVSLAVDSTLGTSTFNQAYVTVTVCAPGTTSNCTTVDHIMIDTHSTGLRVLNTALSLSFINALTPVLQPSTSDPIDECAPINGGYLWGSVRAADVYMSGEMAPAQSVEIVGDTTAGNAPTTCTTQGGSLGSQTALGANGVLGIGPAIYDCGVTCTTSTSASSQRYYVCADASSCSTPGTVPEDQQVKNLASGFGSDANGTVIELPSISSSGASSATGLLLFGVGSQSDNTFSSVTTIPLDANGEFTATYKGVAYPSSFLALGLPATYLPDSTITPCGTPYTGYFCASPTQTAALTLTSNTSTHSTATIDLNVGDAQTDISSGYAAFDDLTYDGVVNSGIALGMPFAFGRTIVIKNESSSGAGDASIAFL